MASSCLCCICFLLILGIVSLLIVYFVGGKDDIDDLKDKFQDNLEDLFRQEDPFAGLNDTQKWPNSGSGLQLTILNALDSEWYTYFDTAVAQWDAGTPDSLTLTTEIRDPEFDCIPEEGYLKVCNGDYGETNWKGINKALIDGSGQIYASTSMMNTFYLTGNAAERQYTMCHEMGHGFGLPHTDENFYNRDQGNCMDYTMNPGRNQQPDEENFLLLAKVYGEVNGGSVTSSSANAAGSDPSLFSSTGPDELSSHNLATNTSFTDTHNDGDRNLRRRRNHETSNLNSDTTTMSLPNWIMDASNEIDLLFINKNKQLGSSSSRSAVIRKNPDRFPRQLLQVSKFAETHVFDIGEGYSIEVHLLLN
jgi:hypothetical protein